MENCCSTVGAIVLSIAMLADHEQASAWDDNYSLIMQNFVIIPCDAS